MNVHTQKLLIDGAAGQIELALDLPDTLPARGLALVAHPHPLFGGTLDNKVVQTIARAFIQLGYITVRSNFRGVGGTAGTHDHGIAERADLVTVLAWLHQHYDAQCVEQPPKLALAGFSFGSYVVSHVAQTLAQQGQPAERIVMVGTAASRWEVATVPADTIVIHGELDDTVPIQSVYDWARPQELPLIVIPGADHFFHRKLPLLKQIILNAWRVVT